jgi:hypothetical protein
MQVKRCFVNYILISRPHPLFCLGESAPYCELTAGLSRCATCHITAN